ncbi:glycosyltransferase family 25 protein [Arcobacter arenosus]|uniref:glycosyltransferase family 25 protein n=1 Tax=Arcobacter arenosus TaxID=2576037 RepID=UPI003BA8BD71
MLFNIEVFIVNLEKDIKKRKYMEQLFEKNTSLKYNFIQAIYGKDLSIDDLNSIYSEKQAKKILNRELSLGEIGCALSHKIIYQQMIDQNIGIALIVEDDISFNNDLSKALEKVTEFPNDWEIVLLGHHPAHSRKEITKNNIWGLKQNLFNNYSLVRPAEHAYGTYGYMISLKGAKKLLKELNKIYMPIDRYTGSDKMINLYMFSPPIIQIDDDTSNMSSMSDRTKITTTMKKLNVTRIIKNLLIYIGIRNARDNLKKFLPLKKYKR